MMFFRQAGSGFHAHLMAHRPMNKRIFSTNNLSVLTAAISRAILDTPAEDLPQAVCHAMQTHLPHTGLLTARQRQGSAEHYVRHILYAHPQGLFTIMALVWRPGQATPVHGHYTWCTYFMLEGTMQEERFTWDPLTRSASACGKIARPQGCMVGGHAGLEHIHRLRNDTNQTAISIHVYGVDGPRSTTHVNRLVALHSGAGADRDISLPGDRFNTPV